MKNKANTPSVVKAGVVFAAAIIIRLLHPLELTLSASIFEYVAAATLAMLFPYFAKKGLIQNRQFTKWELIGFGVFSWFSTLSYIYGRNLSLHDTNITMGIYMVAALIVNFYLAGYGYRLIELLITGNGEEPESKHLLAKLMRKNNFWFYFSILFIAYLINLLINYPGTLMFDPMIQILQIYKFPNMTTSQVNLIDPNQFITTHHPLVHTMLIKLFLYIGECVGSLDAGVFLYSLFQIAAMAAAIAYLLKKVQPYFKEKGMLAWLLIFAFHPIVLMYSALMTKDTIFAVLFAIFGLKFYEYIKNKDIINNPKWAISFSIIVLLCSLFRNNFFYAALLTFVILLFVRKDKALLKVFISYLCVYLTFTSVLVPALGFTKGSIREAISVPFQQTANYAKYYELTEEEEEVISRILDLETLKEYETPEVSNLVKNTFNKNATKEDLLNYFITWIKMFFKHPLAYFDAYFNQFYGYFSTKPYLSSSYTLKQNIDSREQLIIRGLEFAEILPNMTAKEISNTLLTILSIVPGFYLITNSGIYIWIICACIIMLLRTNKKHHTWFYLPFIVYFLSMLISPANASIEYRYMYPYLVALPVLLVPARVAIIEKFGQVETKQLNTKEPHEEIT